MNKSLAIAALLLVNAVHAADWTFVRSTTHGTLHVDFSTVRKEGNLSVLSALIDYPQPQKMFNDTYKSHTHLVAYDCVKGQRNMAIQQAKYYEGNMATGRVIIEDAGNKWIMIDPKGMPEQVTELQFVCGRLAKGGSK